MAPNLARLIGDAGPNLRLRQAIVTSTPAGGTVTVRFGDLASTTLADDIPGVHYHVNAVFGYGDTVYLLQDRGVLLILGKFT